MRPPKSPLCWATSPRPTRSVVLLAFVALQSLWGLACRPRRPDGTHAAA